MTAILFTWTDDGSFAPRPAFRKKCDAEFVIGETYRLEPREERSWRSHQHYFAAVHDAWLNLPEHLAEQIPTAEHLRKWALMKAGYRHERKIAAETAEQAQKLVALVQSYDDFAVVTVSENVVTVHTAKSQSMKAMGKAEFQRSKDDVLGIIAGLIDVEPDELGANAGQAA